MQIESCGVVELNETEMQDTEGGIIPALVIGGILLLWPTPAY